MNKFRLWIHAARPATLFCAWVPVMLGGVVAEHAHGFSLLPWLGALLGAFLIQVGTNFANDVFDFLKGADTEERVGPMRLVQSGHASVQTMMWAMGIAFGLATLVGCALVYHAGWPIFWIGIFSIASGIAYTGGPYPLGYNGLGDIFVFVFFGLVAVCGTVFVQMQAIPTLAWWASIPVGALSTAILVVNNIRDVDTDRVTGKRTLAVRAGKGPARAEYLLMHVASHLTPLAIFLTSDAHWAIFLPWLSLPMSIRLCRNVYRRSDAETLNRTLKQTAILLLIFGSLLAIGIAWPNPR